MANFAINPPNSPLTDSRGYVTSPWYRWFSRVQDVLGDDAVAAIAAAPVLTYSATTAFSDDKILTAGTGIGLTSGASTLTVALTASGVTAAAYGAADTVPTFTVDTYGRLTLATDVAIAISASAVTSGTLAVARGGTGISSYTAGDIIYASGSTTLSALADVATGNALISGGVGVAPSWGKVGLTTHVSGILASSNGGTGNGFTAFSGPATTEKTFTLPNASATILTDNAVVTAGQGGTGVSNTGTITLGGNFTTSGAFTLTLTVTGNTNVTLPTTGTLATLAGSETLTNKTISGGILTGATTLPGSGTISSSGFIGLGTSTVPARLTLVGGISGSDATASGTIQLSEATTALSDTGGLEFKTSSFGSGYGWKASSIDSSGVHLAFGTRQNSATWSEMFRFNSGGAFQMGGANTVITSDRHHQLRTYTVATLPAAGTAGRMIYVSDETGGAVPAFDDGTNWRRCTDRAVVS